MSFPPPSVPERVLRRPAEDQAGQGLVLGGGLLLAGGLLGGARARRGRLPQPEEHRRGLRALQGRRTAPGRRRSPSRSPVTYSIYYESQSKVCAGPRPTAASSCTTETVAGEKSLPAGSTSPSRTTSQDPRRRAAPRTRFDYSFGDYTGTERGHRRRRRARRLQHGRRDPPGGRVRHRARQGRRVDDPALGPRRAGAGRCRARSSGCSILIVTGVKRGRRKREAAMAGGHGQYPSAPPLVATPVPAARPSRRARRRRPPALRDRPTAPPTPPPDGGWSGAATRSRPTVAARPGRAAWRPRPRAGPPPPPTAPPPRASPPPGPGRHPRRRPSRRRQPRRPRRRRRHPTPPAPAAAPAGPPAPPPPLPAARRRLPARRRPAASAASGRASAEASGGAARRRPRAACRHRHRLPRWYLTSFPTLVSHRRAERVTVPCRSVDRRWRRPPLRTARGPEDWPQGPEWRGATECRCRARCAVPLPLVLGILVLVAAACGPGTLMAADDATHGQPAPGGQRASGSCPASLRARPQGPGPGRSAWPTPAPSSTRQLAAVRGERRAGS